MALMVYKTCCQVEGGLPSTLRLYMLINIGLDFALGLVPFLGDLADAMFKANSRNALLLEQHLRDKGKKELRKSGQPIPAIDPSSPEEFDRIRGESPPAYQPQATSHPAATAPGAQPKAPEKARVRESRRWFGRSKNRPRDVEMGQDDNAPSQSRPAYNEQPGGRA